MTSSKLKPSILFITPLPPPVHGSAMMSQYVKDSKLINKTFNCDYVNLSTSRRMDEIGKKPLLKMVRFIWAYCIVLGKLMYHRYDLCYLAITCRGIGFLKDAPFVLLCKLFRRKIVIHQHNKGMSRDVERWPYRWLMPWIYRNTKVILLSWRLYPDIKKIVEKDQILICSNGIPDTLQEELEAKRNNRIPHLLFLSNLMVSKGVIVLLDALEILKNKDYSFICDFVGGETAEIDAARFKAEVEKRGLDKLVIYAGKQYGADKEHFFQQADVFVHPTMDDCFPLVLLEAMQNSLPKVSTDVGGIADIIENKVNGYVCETLDADIFAQKLSELIIDEPLRLRMGESGHEKYKRQYTIEQFEANIKEILTVSM